MLHRVCEGSDTRNNLNYHSTVAVEHREGDTTEDEAPRVDEALDHAEKSTDEQERLSLGGWPPKSFLANRRALALLLWLETSEFTGALRLNTGHCGANFDEHSFDGIETVAELFIMPGVGRLGLFPRPGRARLGETHLRCGQEARGNAKGVSAMKITLTIDGDQWEIIEADVPAGYGPKCDGVEVVLNAGARQIIIGESWEDASLGHAIARAMEISESEAEELEESHA